MSNTQQLNEALASNYLLADIQLRSWSGKKTDKIASEEITATKGAVKGAAKVVKDLLASADVELEGVRSRGTAIRNFVYSKTLPWTTTSDGAKRGQRLLPSAETMGFLKELNTRIAEYKTAVDTLTQVWAQRVLQAQANLGTMADPLEYPDASALQSLFACSVDLQPIPVVADFTRLNVPAALADALGARHQHQAELQVKNAMDELRQRFMDELERFEKQMAKQGSGEKTRLYESLVTNMQGLVAMARNMNITGNPKLAELADRIEAKLLQHPVDVYKNDVTKAQVAAAEAKELQMAAAVDDVWSQI